MITWHIAGLVHSKKEFKEKVMTKLYMQQEHLSKIGQSDREEILSEIWAADKKLIDGKWYVCLSDVCEILGSNE